MGVYSPRLGVLSAGGCEKGPAPALEELPIRLERGDPQALRHGPRLGWNRATCCRGREARDLDRNGWGPEERADEAREAQGIRCSGEQGP